ncbi:hypothetical protein BT96DRAFT_941601 [Gymnopus androsaceus JB14]|uniref:Uncharacterized protein n=1 Tax=Gymnopus androsaceus JB14 TaxID=1447944 RepID=A0A6A4HI93_9AGAR|nr:hypothetical protein BT96DRAFT_941601 [Gymnopus androsaceus JB14]
MADWVLEVFRSMQDKPDVSPKEPQMTRIRIRQSTHDTSQAGFNNRACKSQLSSKLSAKHEKAEIADEQAEQDFLNLCRSFSESNDEDTNYSREPSKDGFLPDAPVASPVPVLFAGKDNAWWRAEYARRDAAFPGEERAQQASKRYYERLAIFVVLC